MSSKPPEQQVDEQNPGSLQPVQPSEPSLQQRYYDIHRRIQLAWAEARACQEVLTLEGQEPAASDFTAGFHQIDDRFEERSNQLHTFLRQTLREVRKGLVGIVKDINVSSILLSLQSELLGKENSDAEAILAGVKEKIADYETQTRAELDVLLSTHALPIIHLLVKQRAFSLMRKDDHKKAPINSAEYLQRKQELGLRYVQTLYEVLTKNDAATVKNVTRMTNAIHKKIKEMEMFGISARTIHRWAQGGPLHAKPAFFSFLNMCRQKGVDDTGIGFIEEAYANYRAFVKRNVPVDRAE